MGVESTRTHAWAWYLAAVVFVTQYYVVSAYGAAASDGLYIAIGASAVVAGLVGLALHRPPRLLAWVVVVASIATYLIADAVLANLEEESVIVPFPSLADWLYLSIYPALAIAFVVIRRALAPGSDRRDTVDSVIVGVAAFGVLAPLYLADLWNSPFLDDGQRWVAVAYPLGDALLLAVGARLVLAGGRRLNALALLGAAAAAVTIGNAVFNVDALGDGHTAGGVASVGWLAFTSLLAGAALHPSVRFSGSSAPAARTPWPAVVPPLAVLSIVGAHLLWGDADSRTMSIASLVVVLLLIPARGPFRRQPTASPSSANEQAVMSNHDDANAPLPPSPSITR